MQRPTAVTVFGVLNIAFAVLGVISLGASFAMFSAIGPSNNPVVEIVRENPTYAAWMKVSLPLGIISCLVLLAAGIGLLLMKEWARKLSIIYAVYAFVFTVIGSILNFFFLTRPLLERASQAQDSAAMGATAGAIGGSLGGCFGLIYPILLLIFMLRPKIVAAFRSSSTPPSLPPT